ncbi:HD family hydrolase [Candidatus Dependentiae bacterium]|nr:HD family hydrolase [Candidatus Dependentiae bacterium]
MDSKKTAKDLIDLFEKTGVLKRIPRMGWKMRGVPECESVADHSFRVIVIAMVLGDILKSTHKINMERLMRSAILHELPESELTDLALGPALSVGRDVKHKAECTAFKKIFAEFDLLEEYFEQWIDFEECRNIEGKIVKLADKLDMMIQAYEYEKVGIRNLNDFWNNNENYEAFEFQIITEVYNELKLKREKLHK